MSSILETVLSYLPQAPGLLPKWLLFVSIVAMGNSIQTYSTLHFTRRVYSARPHDVNTLSSRTFGTWTFLSAIIRAYAAYNVSNGAVYDIALWSYIIAGVHFISEWLIFGTANLGAGLAGPLVVSTTSVAWMLTQRDWYLALGL
ncbi:ergosterol biosynthesis protein [Rhizina undulata]